MHLITPVIFKSKEPASDSMPLSAFTPHVLTPIIFLITLFYPLKDLSFHTYCIVVEKNNTFLELTDTLILCFGCECSCIHERVLFILMYKFDTHEHYSIIGHRYPLLSEDRIQTLKYTEDSSFFFCVFFLIDIPLSLFPSCLNIFLLTRF